MSLSLAKGWRGFFKFFKKEKSTDGVAPARKRYLFSKGKTEPLGEGNLRYGVKYVNGEFIHFVK